MFRLIKLCSSGIFDEVKFHDGLNIIYGKYSSEKQSKDINGIGKTTIINMIDYCLGGNSAKKSIKKIKSSLLKGQYVELHFEIDNKEYAVQRYFDRSTKANVKTSGSDYVEYSEKELRILLGSKTFKASDYQGISDSAWYRTMMNFFIQMDHKFIARNPDNLAKFLGGGQRNSELMIYSFFLMGVNNNRLFEFDAHRVLLSTAEESRKQIRNKIYDETGKEPEALAEEVSLVEAKVDKIRQEIKNYEFKSSDENTKEQLNSVTQMISDVGRELFLTNQELLEIKSSYKLELEIDIKEIGKIYEQFDRDFGEFIQHELSEVIEFRKQLAINRQRFLKEKEYSLNKKVEMYEERLSELELKRQKLFESLKEYDAFESITNAYDNLMEEHGAVQTKKNYTLSYKESVKEIAQTKTKITQVIEKVVEESSKIDNEMVDLKNIFSEMVEASLPNVDVAKDSFFTINIRDSVQSPVEIKMEIPREDSLGKGRLKLLFYDLTLFFGMCQSQRGLPSFLIHDGVFHAIAHKTRVNLLNYVNKKLNDYSGSQYIITINEDEIIMPDSEGDTISRLNFNLESKIISKLEDKPDRMLLGIEF